MALFDGSADTGGGLMGMFANPQTAGLLGMAGGLLSAAGPSRLPVTNGQALGAGMMGAQQGYTNALNTQRQLLQMGAMQGLMGMAGGGSQGTQSAQQSAPSYSSMFGPSSNAPASMSASSGVGGSPAGSSASGAPAQSTGTIYGKTPQQLFQQGMLMNMAGIQGGGDLMRVAVEHDPSLAAQMPTDITKMGVQAGMSPQQIQAANAAGITKSNALSIRPGGGVMIGDRFITMPGAAPAGYMNQQGPDGNWSVVPIQGGADAVRGSAAATAGGKAQYNLQQVWDPAANNGQGGFVYQSTANVADAAGGNGAPQVPVGIRNNNFGNIRSADGKGFATYDTPQAGVNAADQTLATYGSKYGINTLTGIANRWSPTGDGNNNPTQKAAAMAAASGVGVNQPINLADPATRARILPALFDTETPGWRNAIQGAPAAQETPARGPMAAQPPLGQTNAASASQAAPSHQMADSYGALSTADASYQQSREALNEMLNLAHNKGGVGAAMGVLPESVSTRISPDAATYQKAHATYVALQGKALGSGGTDASRATINEAVPTYDKPQSAMVTGLTNQLNNLDMAHLKTQFLTPTYQQGNEKAYTQQSAAFDRNITPTMMPILQLSGDQQRAAVQAAIKANPALRGNFEWAFNNGMLK